MSTDVKESLSGSKLLELLQSDIPLSEEELTHIIRALNHELSNSPSRQLARARMSLLETLRAVKQKKYQEAAVRSQLISILQQVEHQKAVRADQRPHLLRVSQVCCAGGCACLQH